MRARVTRNAVRICVAVNPRFPGQGQSSQGQSEPKARPKGVVDEPTDYDIQYHHRRTTQDRLLKPFGAYRPIYGGYANGVTEEVVGPALVDVG